MHFFKFWPTFSPTLLSRSLLVLLISTFLTNSFALLLNPNVSPNYLALHDLTSSQYQNLFDTLVSQGYRLLLVTGYVSGGQEQFAALFEQSPGPPQICYHGLTSDGYQSKFNEATARGFRPVLVNGYTSLSNTDKYVAIFENPPSTPSWVARHGMTSARYQQEFDYWVARGFRLTHVSGYGVGTEARYAAIFDQSGGPAWVARHGLTSSQYQTVFNEQVNAGLTLTLVSGYTVNNVDYYAAIFQRLPGKAWVARHGLTSSGYRAVSAGLYSKGYRLTCVSGYTISNAGRFAAIWAKPSSFFSSPLISQAATSD